MKIAFFSDCYLDMTGGIVSSINAVKAELERLGHTVYVFSTGFPRSKEARFMLAKKHIYEVPSCWLFFRGLAPISRRPAIIEKWLVENFPELKDFDIFHTHYESGCSIAGMRLGRRLGIPVVQTMHGREDMGETNIIPYGLRTFVATNINWFHSWYLPHKKIVKKDRYLADNFAKAKMWTMMVNHANNADIVLSPSLQFKRKLEHYGVEKKIEVVPNAVKDELVGGKGAVRKLEKGEKLKIIWHSRVSEEKRMMPFLRALKTVNGNYEMRVYGGGGDFFRARRFAKKNQMNVAFYNTSPFEVVAEAMDWANLDVLVSYNFDTFGMTLIEAEAKGLPVFICDPDFKEVVPKGSYKLAAGPEPEKMAKALQDLIDNPEQIEKMSRVMIENREEVKQSLRIKKLIKIYEGAIKES